jgi:hypothetical protein
MSKMPALWLALQIADWTKLHEELVPKRTEAWQTIPWRVDLLEARAAAIEEGKPLFLWSMNGHPLGCT